MRVPVGRARSGAICTDCAGKVWTVGRSGGASWARLVVSGVTADFCGFSVGLPGVLEGLRWKGRGNVLT